MAARDLLVYITVHGQGPQTLHQFVAERVLPEQEEEVFQSQAVLEKVSVLLELKRVGRPKDFLQKCLVRGDPQTDKGSSDLSESQMANTRVVQDHKELLRKDQCADVVCVQLVADAARVHPLVGVRGL